MALKISGKNVQMQLGSLKMSINSRGSVDSLKKNGIELLVGLTGAPKDANKYRSFYLDYHANGKFRDFKPSEIKVIAQTEERIHIAYIDHMSLLYVEYHYRLEAGVDGVYSYVVVRNNCSEPLEVGELRTVYRMGITNFDTAYMSERIGKQPSHRELQQQRELQDETFEYDNGDVYSKYDYAGYFNENPVWGQYGERFGAWFIPVSTEYYSGGPLKQELLVHYDGIILNYMTGAHLGSGTFKVPQDWEKIYGPWLFYVNEGTPDEMIEDAHEVAVKEQAKWPYQWVDERLYPLERFKVKGSLAVPDGRSTAKAMVVLSGAGPEVIRQKDGYYFYGQCDENGCFEIPHVRPGTYLLTAYATHGIITQQFSKENILITEDVDLGTLMWEVPSRCCIWQLGQANRKSTDFKYSDELRGYKWMNLLPQELDFYIGVSNEKEDWYYAQPQDSRWQLHFDLEEVVQEPYYLTVAFAGVTTQRIGQAKCPLFTVEVNGQIVSETFYENDQAVYRSSLRGGRHHLLEIEVDGALLRTGGNVVTFKSQHGAFMYDTILLET